MLFSRFVGLQMTALLSSMFYASADHSSILKSDKYNALLQVQTSCLCSCGCAALLALFCSSIETLICCYHIICSNQLLSHCPFCKLFSCPIPFPSHLLLSPSISLAPLPFHLTCSSPLPSHLLLSPSISLALLPFFLSLRATAHFAISGKCIVSVVASTHAHCVCCFCGGAPSRFPRHRLNDPTVRFSTNFVFPLIGPFEGP
jgi:hypothetical protein